MRARQFISAALVAFAFAAAAPAHAAEKLIASLSTDRILIESNFSGGDIAIFGAVEDAPANAVYDAVVTVRGPRGAVTVRRKQPWGPFWFNLDNRKYIGIPAYIAVLSNRDVQQIASAEVRDDLRIGIDASIPPQVARRGANDPEFRAALRRLREDQGLFLEDDTALKFISPRVFKATVNLPGGVPLGKYEVDVALFSGGALQARQTLSFSVTKTDVEQTITSLAHDRPFLYGVLISLMALFLGWAASIVFRRD
ncbi:MAG: TIGR02186 family protein [Beijerinckiaceae bacterium]